MLPWQLATSPSRRGRSDFRFGFRGFHQSPQARWSESLSNQNIIKVLTISWNQDFTLMSL